MGEVYRAADTRLGHDVALKILPQSFASDADRMARFEREALRTRSPRLRGAPSEAARLQETQPLRRPQFLPKQPELTPRIAIDACVLVENHPGARLAIVRGPVRQRRIVGIPCPGKSDPSSAQ
ncbi:MAG TPA: hypothetical protein VEV17_16975 [Bryobacteraceae bacterium]|nr:hypothetical protein [Bryobacteraceae bacterium]